MGVTISPAVKPNSYVARVSGTATSVTTSTNTITWSATSFDANGMFNGTTTFTAPITGKYRVTMFMLTSSVTWSATHITALYWNKNAGGNIEFARNPVWAAVTQVHGVNGSDTISMTVGDTLTLAANSSVTTTPVTIQATFELLGA